MLKQPKQFELPAQFDETCRELSAALLDAQNAINRVLWLKDETARQFAEITAAADALEIYTEEEAAGVLKIEVSQLAKMRRNLDLPHCNFGNKTRYTKVQLVRITEILEMNSQRKAAGQIRRAA